VVTINFGYPSKVTQNQPSGNKPKKLPEFGEERYHGTKNGGPEGQQKKTKDVGGQGLVGGGERAGGWGEPPCQQADKRGSGRGGFLGGKTPKGK